MSLFEERVKRTKQAVAMEKVDKIPFSYSGPAYVARRQGLTIAKYVSDFKAATDASVKFCKTHPGIDSIHTPCMAPQALSLMWLSEVWIPGKELPDDELWQIREYERIDEKDYHKIIDEGYDAWFGEYVQKLKVDFPAIQKWAEINASYTLPQVQENAQVMFMNYCGSSGGPIEGLCGARTLMSFFVDLMEEPELVKQAMDKMFESQYRQFVQGLDAIPKEQRELSGAWVGGWRAAPNMLSHEQFMTFCWPYIEKYVIAAIDRGVIPILHFDSNWDSEIETIHTLPAKKCILMLDGSTNIRRAREILGDDMCILGDVPSRMLAYSTADEVYDYVTKLIDDVGHDTGLIVSSGCDCPMNAKDENVDAMIQATVDYSVK